MYLCGDTKKKKKRLSSFDLKRHQTLGALKCVTHGGNCREQLQEFGLLDSLLDLRPIVNNMDQALARKIRTPAHTFLVFPCSVIVLKHRNTVFLLPQGD